MATLRGWAQHHIVAQRMLIASSLVLAILVAGCDTGAAARAGPTATRPQTPVPPLQGVKVPRLVGISMVSTDDGWILGQDDFYAGVGTFLLRFRQGVWVREPFPVQSPSPGLTFSPMSIAMISATEGWVAGALHDATGTRPDVATIFHDHGGTWRQEPLPAGLTAITALAMLASDTGWALGQTSSGTGPTTSQIVRYRGGQWTTEAVFPDASLTTISMASATDGWAAAGNLLLRYANDAWSAVALHLGSGVVSRSYTSVSMAAATAGWAAALDQAPDVTCTECGGGGSTLVLLRYADGAWQEWQPAGPIPTAGGNGSDVAVLSTSVVAVSASELWVADGVIIHYTNGQPAASWSRLPRSPPRTRHG